MILGRTDMKRTSLGTGMAIVAAALGMAVAAVGCGSLATPQAPGSGSPGTAGGTVNVSQQVKDGAQLYVAFACVRCHAPDGTGGVPNRLNSGGDSTIPALNNAYREKSQQFTNAVQITQVMMDGSIISSKPGVINMPSWKGVINAAQASAIAAYILAGFPHTAAAYDPNPASGSDIYTAYACIDCHGQVGQKGAPNPLSADGIVPSLRNPSDNITLPEFRTTITDGSIPAPGKKGEIFMPAWGQIMSTDQVNTILPYIPDGPAAKALPAPPAATPLPLAAAGGSASPAASSTP
jgi:mono/diheme cytochrome c family protein